MVHKMLASRLNCKNTYCTCTLCRVNGLMGKRELNHCYYPETSISLCNEHITIINKKYNLKEYKAINKHNNNNKYSGKTIKTRILFF